MKFSAFFTSSGVPQTGLNPTISVWLPNGSQIVTEESMTGVAGGWYYYTLGGFENERDYFIRADGGASLPAAERYTFSVNAPVGGGGLSLTGDMVMTLKKMEDNLATKKEIEELLEKLTGVVTDVGSKFDKKKEKKDNKEISKMSSDVNDKIDLLVKESKGASQELAKSLRKDFKDLDSEVKKVNSEMKKNKEDMKKDIKIIIDLNNKVTKNIENIETTKFPEVNKLIKGNHVILHKSSDVLNNVFSNVSGIQTNLAHEFGTVSEGMSKLSEFHKKNDSEVGKISTGVTKLFDLNKENISKFREEEKASQEKIVEAFKIIQSKFQENAKNHRIMETFYEVMSKFQEVSQLLGDDQAHEEFKKEHFKREDVISIARKISETNEILKKKFGEVPKKQSRPDDIGEVMDQMKMLDGNGGS